MLLEFSVAVVSCLDETRSVGNVHDVSSTIVAEFDFPTENLNYGHLTSAISLWFSFKSHLYHIASWLWYLNVNSEKMDFFNAFFPLPDTCHFETCHLTPIFYFMILIRTVLPFNGKKIGINYVHFFGNFTKLYGLSYRGLNSKCPN